MGDASSLGFGHFLAQTDIVAKVLLAVLVIMSAISWYLIVYKGISQVVRQKRSQKFLTFFWSATSLEAVQAELNVHGVHEPFGHLTAHSLHAQAHHAKFGAAKLDKVDRAAVYLGIFANEYGWEDDEGLSPTEREFGRATLRKKNRLVFVKGTDDSQRHQKMKHHHLLQLHHNPHLL